MVVFARRTDHLAALGAGSREGLTRIERHPMNETSTLRAAAILADGSGDVDALLAAVVLRVQRAGRCVRGLRMTHPDGDASCAGAMVLVDLETQDEYLVSQPLGRDAAGCRADPQGFARASQVLRRAAQQAPDLVVSNRFGALEAAGGGFCAELLALLEQDLPLLTAVAPKHLAAWQTFTGGTTVLPVCIEAVNAWLDRALPGMGPGLGEGAAPC